ncbi:MAG: lyase family protein [Woeseiaceae bacterium]|nr:lyase family protein [Woeseiaceae bacterium]
MRGRSSSTTRTCTRRSNPWLTDLIGEAGGRLHLGRSRNDQVLTALRLYLLDAADAVAASVQALADTLAELTARQGDVALPGYTHMQQAMPSSVALWSDGFAEALDDAIAGLRAARRRMAKNPLGSAAGYGTPGLDLDRDATTRTLGFSETQVPVTAVQLSRGKAEAGLLFELTLLMQDLGRLASDLLLFYTQEFGYVELADDVTTGSSIMPQKRNPDVLELVRGATATVQACLQECLMLVAKLPSGFQRDTQRIKAPLFRGIDLTIDSVDIMAYLVSRMRFLPERIRMDEGLEPPGKRTPSSGRKAFRSAMPTAGSRRVMRRAATATEGCRHTNPGAVLVYHAPIWRAVHDHESRHPDARPARHGRSLHGLRPEGPPVPPRQPQRDTHRGSRGRRRGGGRGRA